jgi:hypothetical protein
MSTGLGLSTSSKNSFLVSSDSGVSYNIAILILLDQFARVVTLIGFEVGKVPDHFTNEVPFLSQLVESFEVLTENYVLIFFRPDEGWQLK